MLKSAKQRIEIQDTEIRRLARAEEDLHVNIKQAYNEQEKIMHEKMQAEMHLQDREAMNKELERKVILLLIKQIKLQLTILET
jgi:hypothetical protein